MTDGRVDELLCEGEDSFTFTQWLDEIENPYRLYKGIKVVTGRDHFLVVAYWPVGDSPEDHSGYHQEEWILFEAIEFDDDGDVSRVSDAAHTRPMPPTWWLLG